MPDISWIIETESDLPRADDWLGPNELARAEQMVMRRRARDFRLGRLAAHRALEAVWGSGEWDVRADEDGAPRVYVAGNRMDGTISLSHRDGLAVCAVSREPLALGIDLERIEPHSEAFVRDFFTDVEQAWARNELDVALVWSAKESTLKAVHHGLRIDTRRCEVCRIDPAVHDGWAALEVAFAGKRYHGYWRRHGDFVITMVADPPVPAYALKALA